MTRGVSWALASCSVISRAEHTKMMSVNIDAAMVARSVIALAGSYCSCQPIADSIR